MISLVEDNVSTLFPQKKLNYRIKRTELHTSLSRKQCEKNYTKQN